jgi:hypothetical protein
MTTTIQKSPRTASRELAQIIEPLANLICAADHPRQTLLSALTVLFDEVEGTHKATLLHVATRRVESLGLAS